MLPIISISNPKSVEPDSTFRIECNISNINSASSVQWYQSNRPINNDNKKYLINVTRTHDGNSNNYKI